MTPQQGFATTIIGFELLFVLLFSANFSLPGLTGDGKDASVGDAHYPMFQDVHVMIFIGFGFLMTFLKKYGMSSVSLNFLVSALAIQWAFIAHPLVEQVAHGKFETQILDIPQLICADYAAGAVLISMGVVLGKTTPTQLVWMTFFEILFFAINEFICADEIGGSDMGGSVVLHLFGAVFGLGVSWSLGVPTEEKTKHNASSYTSDLYAMVGTLFLWMFWPSFNGALGDTSNFDRQRSILNTVLSLCGSCMSAFVLSLLSNKKFDMVHVQNATLAGGVAIGTSCNWMSSPGVTLCVGMVAGALSVQSYVSGQDILEKKFGIHDTCGVFSLHGVPGLVGGLVGAFVGVFSGGYNASEVSAGDQLVKQLLIVAISVGFAAITGAATGLLLRSSAFKQQEKMYEDVEWFETPDAESEKEEKHNPTKIQPIVD